MSSFDSVTQRLGEGQVGARVALRERPRVSFRDAAGAHDVLVERRMVVGSAPGVDIVVAEPTVSRLHAELEPRDDGLWVRDLGSRNGSFVDGIKVEVARLAEGATLRLGSARLAVTEREPVAVDLWPDDHFQGLVGRSVAMRELFARLAKVGPLSSTVLLLGETGTGKELLARALHEASPRAKGPFVIVDCGALPENLLEAELFGHARGAFTGAAASRAGAFEVGSGGTVFLDEIGELPLAMQPKLLRVLESQTVRRLGETQQRPVDCRFVSATNRDLRALVNAGAFREDLYFRLAVVPLTVPPLRERADDIPALVEHFLAVRASRDPAAPVPLISAETRQELIARPWLGNVRELRNFVEQASIFGPKQALAMLPSGAPSGRAAASLPDVPVDRPFKDVRDEWMSHLERVYVQKLLERHGGNVSAVADAAGLDRSYVHRLIRKHDL